MAQAELEFSAKGFTERQAEIAVRRAFKMALSYAERCRPESRQVRFDAPVERELFVSEGWIKNSTSRETKQRYAEGVIRAKERGHLLESFQDMGMDAREKAEKWAEEIPAAIAAYDRKFS
jgi:hypothetical protein